MRQQAITISLPKGKHCRNVDIPSLDNCPTSPCLSLVFAKKKYLKLVGRLYSIPRPAWKFKFFHSHTTFLTMLVTFPSIAPPPPEKNLQVLFKLTNKKAKKTKDEIC